MAEANHNSLPQLVADRERLDKLARLIILRKGLILLFEQREYCIDWLDSNRIEHGVGDRQFRSAIDKLSEESILSLRPISDDIQ